MKKVLLLVIFCSFSFFCCAQSNSHHLKLQKAYPRQGQETTFIYDPTGTDLEGEQHVVAVAYEAAGTDIKAYDVPLTRKAAGWKGKLRPAPNATGLYMKFQNSYQQDSSYRIDTNDNEGYRLLLYDKRKQPVPGARLIAADMLYMIDYQLHLSWDAEEALALFEEEFRKYPQLKRTHFSRYIWAMRSVNGRSNNGPVFQALDWLTKQPQLTEKELMALHYEYQNNGESAKAAYYEKELQRQFPDGEFIRQGMVDIYNKEQNSTNKLILLKALSDKFPGEDMTFQYADLAKAYGSDADVAGFEALLTRHPLAARKEVYKSFVDEFMESGEHRNEVEAFAMEAYRLAQDEVKNPIGEKPKTLSPIDWALAREKAIGSYAESLGNVYLAKREYNKASLYLEEAYTLANIYFKDRISNPYAEALLRAERPSAARTILEEKINNGKGDSTTSALIKEAYLGEHGSNKGFEAYWAKLEAPLVEQLKQKVKEGLIKEATPDFELTDLEGKAVSLSSLKGKTVVLDFWAVWCGFCIKAFPGMQQVMKKYEANEDVVFLYVNTLENGDNKDEKAADLMKQKNYAFRVLMDETDEMAGDFGIKALPSKVVIDKEGYIRYKSVGAGPSVDQAVKELSLVVEAVQ